MRRRYRVISACSKQGRKTGAMEAKTSAGTSACCLRRLLTFQTYRFHSRSDFRCALKAATLPSVSDFQIFWQKIAVVNDEFPGTRKSVLQKTSSEAQRLLRRTKKPFGAAKKSFTTAIFCQKSRNRDTISARPQKRKAVEGPGRQEGISRAMRLVGASNGRREARDRRQTARAGQRATRAGSARTKNEY